MHWFTAVSFLLEAGTGIRVLTASGRLNEFGSTSFISTHLKKILVSG
jgi:hypothetical protein